MQTTIGKGDAYSTITESAAAAFCKSHDSPMQIWATPRNWNATLMGQVTTSRTLRMAKAARLFHLRQAGTCVVMNW